MENSKKSANRTADKVINAGDFRLTVFSDGTFRKDRICPGRIISINKTEKAKQTNVNGNVFWVATVEVDLPSGGTRRGPAIIWDAQLTTTKLPKETFAPGAEVSIAIQVDSEYAGNAQVQLPGGTRFNADDFTAGLDIADAEFAKVMAEMGLEGINIKA